jgi:tRNA nucleotidyltransferase (CCA-adding enzyme)
LNHRKSSPELAKKDLQALGFSNKELQDIMRYIANHHKPEEFLSTKDPQQVEKKLRKFFSEAGFEKANNLLDVIIADRMGQYNPLQNSTDITDIYDLRKVLKKLQKEEGQFTMKDLAVKGNDIIEHFKLPAGPIIGTLIKKALDRVIDDIKGRNKKSQIFAHLGGYLKMIKK